MIHAIFYTGPTVLIYGWNTPTLQIIFVSEIVAVFLCTLVGLFVPPNKIYVLALLALDSVGVLIVLHNLLFGMSSDAYILLPFIGEILCVGTSTALLIKYVKKHNHHST